MMLNSFCKIIVCTQLFLLIMAVFIFFQSQASSDLTTYLYPNHTPTAQAGLDQTMDESSISTRLSALQSRDSDGDTLEYLWAELVDTGDGCSVLDVQAAEPVVTVLNRIEDYSCIFQLVVSDGRTESDPDTVTLFVTADNDAPMLLTDVSAAITEGSAWQITIRASDSEGESLSLELQDSEQAFASAGIAFDKLWTTKKNYTILSWQPNYNQAGSYPLDVTVTDGTNFTTSQHIITVQPTNRAPLLNGAIGDLTVQPTTDTSLIDLTDYFSDPDGDALTYSLSVTDSSVEAYLELRDDQLWLRNNPAPSTVSLRLSASDASGAVVTSNAFTITLTEWAPPLDSGLTSSSITTHSGDRYLVALKARRGHTVKIYDASGQKVTQSKLSPGAIWWVVDAVVNQNNTVDLLFAGQHNTKLYLRYLQFDSEAVTMQLLDSVTVPKNFKQQPQINWVGNTVQVQRADGTMLFEWSIE